MRAAAPDRSGAGALVLPTFRLLRRSELRGASSRNIAPTDTISAPRIRVREGAECCSAQIGGKWGTAARTPGSRRPHCFEKCENFVVEQASKLMI